MSNGCDEGFRLIGIRRPGAEALHTTACRCRTNNDSVIHVRLDEVQCDAFAASSHDAVAHLAAISGHVAARRPARTGRKYKVCVEPLINTRCTGPFAGPRRDYSRFASGPGSQDA